MSDVVADMSHSQGAPAAVFPPLATLKSLLENPPTVPRHFRKLIGAPFGMNGKKDLTASNGMVLASAAAAAAAAAANQAGSWGNDQFEAVAAQAFLGPSIWDKPNPYDLGPAVGAGHDFKLEYMDLDEFLSENGLGNQGAVGNAGAHHPVGVASPHESSGSSPRTHLGSEENKVSSSTGSKERESPGELPGMVHLVKDPHQHPGTELPAADLALATVPGSTVNFDPRRRRFSEEELKPQPMVKKSKKQFVPDEMKDEKYWARRRKNNLAAKRSRDARRIKENQIAIRASYLEKENAKLREQLEKLTRENMLLRDKLANAAKMDKGMS